jgi:glycosyltransferase involved in cell wall biosynthesis
MRTTLPVTAVIDTYNHERFIAEAIESVLAQDFPAGEMEILVVDDGSTDATPEIVRRYSGRVRYLHKENGGQASALNLGFAEARGEIVAFLDGDDVWLPSKVSRVVAEFEKEPDALVVCHPYITWLPDKGIGMEDRGFHPICGMMPLPLADVLRYGNYGTCGMALRRQAAGPLFPLPEDLQIYADTYLVFLAVCAGKVVGLNECLTKYRHHESNLTAFRQPDSVKAKRRWACYASAIEQGKKWLVRHGQDLARPDVAAHVKRHELVVQMLRFYWDPPGRREYFRYLREFHELYRPLWTWRYRAFHRLLAFAGLVLGYETFMGLRDWYRGSDLSLAAREKLFPVHGQEAALS